MKSNYLLIYFLLISAFGFAQSYDIGGTVKETATGLPIPGVNVQVKNTTKGTSSDIDGNFTLGKIQAGSVVVFSSIGFKNFEYTVTSNNLNLSVSLSEDTKTLEEVVVIGYGSQKKKEVTGSVSTVDSKTLEILKPIKVEQALQGTVSGVNVTSQSGSPGAGLDIRIRGIGTNGSAGPTTIIDGYVGELGLLNPNDIETITVLKDAQAAIYGTIGANGIILITTKKGKKNSKPVIGFSDLTPLLNWLSREGKIPTFYGPVVTQLGAEPAPETLASLQNTLRGIPTQNIPLKNCTIIKKGVAAGSFVGGCLSMITSSIGTHYELDFAKKVLFLEDVNEKIYQVDRMLTQLKNTGQLQKCRAILFGSLVSPNEEPSKMADMLKDVLSDFAGPVLTGIPAGHQPYFLTLPIGVECKVDTAQLTAQFHYE